MTVGPEGSTRKERKLDELSHARSEGSSGSSKLAGRCDNSTYAEAMQCVADLTDVVSVKNAHNRRATNQIEAFLLTDIEESSDSSRSDSMSSVHLGPRKARGSVSDDAMAPPPVEEAMDVGHGPEEQQPVPPVAGDDDDEVRPPGLHQWLVRRIFIACVVGLIMLAPSIATIALYASDPFDEEVEFPPTFAQANLGQIFELILRPVYALATAYLATKLLASFIMNARVQRWIPGFLLLFMHHTFNLGWALPAVLYPAAIGFFYGIGADDEAWDFLVDLRHFVATALWLMAWGLCSAILDSSVAFLQRHLTLHHYEQRSQTAYDTQRCLRKIVAAAHAAKRQAEKVRDKSVEAAAGVLQVRMRQFAQHVARERLLRRSSRTSANSSRSATNLPNSASATSLPQSASANGLPTSASANALPTSISGTALPLSASAKSLPSMATPRPPDLHKELKEPKEYKEPKEPKEHKELKEYHEQRKVLPPPELEVKIVRTLSEHVAEHERSKKPPAPPPRSASKAKLFPDAAAAEARAAAPPAKNNPPRAGIRSKELDRQLDILSGPLDLGPGIMAAKTFSQAGRRAIKVFRTLMAQDVLRVPQPETMEPAIDRDRLVAWAYRDGGKKPSSRLAGNVFRYGNAITMEEFIQVFERSYQEQRLITASVAAFDRLHSEVRVFLQVILCLVFLILLLAVWSVSVVTWLVPIGSAVLSISVLAGGITGDILDCFFFAYIIRPYDIGDRVAIAPEAQNPALLPCLIKDVFLMRTHFYAASGDLMMVSNSSLRKLAITNFSRSGPLTLMVEIMVPANSLTAKLTELLDAIGAYVKESEEWSAADIQFYSVHTNEGYMMLRVWATSKYKAEDLPQIMDAKSRMILFCHSYMQTAGIDFVQPILPVRQDVARTADTTSAPGPFAGFFTSRPGP